MFAYVTAYSIQGQNVQIISPTSESHQQVVAVGQPLSSQPQGTVVVKKKKHIYVTTLVKWNWLGIKKKSKKCIFIHLHFLSFSVLLKYYNGFKRNLSLSTHFFHLNSFKLSPL